MCLECPSPTDAVAKQGEPADQSPLGSGEPRMPAEPIRNRFPGRFIFRVLSEPDT